MPRDAASLDPAIPDTALVDLRLIEPNIALVTLNRPEARNAITAETAAALEAVVDRIEADPDIRVAIITGAGGKAFCSGADLRQVARGGLGAMFTARGGFAGFVHANRTKPWIAAVEGFALAGGCEIALACDLLVATSGSSFGLPEVTRGLIASAGGLYRLPRSLPRSIALELILTGEAIGAPRAFDLGVINRLAPDGQVVEVALELARRIAACAPLAVRESLAVARASYDEEEVELRRRGDEAQLRLEKTADFAEGSLAFTQKRAPHWLGR